MVGGFESLTGQMDFYNMINTRRPNLIGNQISFASSYHSFSPDSRYFITAVLSPRMRQDNGYALFTFNGTKVTEENIDSLYRVAFRPLTDDTPLASFPITTGTIADRDNDKNKKSSVYKPPRAREREAQARGRGGRGGRGRGRGRGGRGGTPGATPVGGQLKKTAKAGNPFNRYRSLQKKLADIEKLKKRRADGETLQDNQITKIQSEAALRREASELEEKLNLPRDS